MNYVTQICTMAGGSIDMRSIENPSTPLSDPDDWLYDALGAGRTASGIRVNSQTALTYAALWRGVNLISRHCGKLPLIVYKREGDGKVRDTKHKAYKLCRRKPNSVTLAMAFRQTLTAHAVLQGSGYAYVYRRGSGAPLELVQLQPQITWAVRDNGVLWYTTEVDGERRKLRAEDVIHIKGLSYDGIVPYRTIHKARDSLGLGMAAQRFGARFFKNSASPRVIVETPNKMSADAQKEFLRQWNHMHEGLDNAHKTAILTGGAKINPFSLSAVDAQLIETRKFEIREVANWLCLPPHKLGDDSRLAYNSLEQENQAYLDDSLDPWLCQWEEECSDKLLSEEEKDEETHSIEFDLAPLLRANMAVRSAYYRTALGGRAWMSQNEVRAQENLNPVPGGDDILDPLNMGKGGANNDPTDPLVKNDPAADEVRKNRRRQKPDLRNLSSEIGDEKAARRKARRALICDVLGRMTRRLGMQARRASKKPGEFTDWIDAFPEEHRDVIQEALRPALAVCRTWQPGEAEASAKRLADSLLQRMHSELNAICDRAKPAELAAAVESFCVTFERDQPSQIANILFPEKTPCK